MEEPPDAAASFTADAESRFLVLLRYDLVDSTGISNALNASDELAFRRRYTSVVEALIDPAEVKLEWDGDGGLMVFGYPDARVDAPETAVRTGLKLIDAVRSIDAVPRIHPQVRVGIACGRVTIDKTRNSLATVKPVSRATRLMQSAHPSQLLVAEDTKRLVDRYFDYDDIGILELQGAGRRRVWRVLAETPVVSRFAARHDGDSRSEIVGREDILSRLADAWSVALEGHGSALCLVGDSGIGKSRLARVVLEWAQRDAATALEIDCTPSTGNAPLLPIGVLLRRLAHIEPGTPAEDKERDAINLLTPFMGEADARERVRPLAALFGMEPAPIPLDKTRDQVRAMTIAAIVDIVRACAEKTRLVVLCEDLHWADDTTAQVIQSVAQIVSSIPALLMVTRWPKSERPIDMDAICATFTTIPVEPLAGVSAAHLVRSVAGRELPAEQVDDIVNRCGGVPLLLEEVTRSTVEQVDAGAAVRPAHASDSAVPPELQLVVESRLELWPQLRGIIEAASVLGREFPVALLETMPGARGRDIPSAIVRFAELGLFAPQSEHGRASFRHALIRDAVYETVVGKEYLRRLHSDAADSLIAHYSGTPDASPDVLAHHLRLAHRLEQAIGIRLVAAEETFNRGAYKEAHGHCSAVRGLFDELGDPAAVRADALRLHVLAGMVESGINGYSSEEAVLEYRRAHEMFDERTGYELRYPVSRGLAAALLLRGDLAQAYSHSVEGMRLAEQSGRADYRIDAMSLLAYTTLYYGRLAECREWIDRVLTLYETERGERFRYPVPQDAKTAALALLPTCAWLLGDPAGADQAVDRGLQHVEALGRDFDKAMLNAWTAGTRYTQRRYLEAATHAGVAYALGHEHKFQEWEGVGAMMALISQSALAPSLDAVQKAVETAGIFQQKGVGLNGSYFLWGIARGYLKAGIPDAAKATLMAALQVAAASNETRMNPEIWILQAEIESDDSIARKLLRDAYQLAQAQGAIANALRAAATMVRRFASGTDAGWAQSTLERLDGRDAGKLPATWMHDELAHAIPIVSGLVESLPV